jgi:putative flavoprotein involved in K+ transport
VLVVGAANSGAEIALEVSRGHRTWLSGRHPGQEPFRPGSGWDRLLMPVVWFLVSHVLTVKTPIGRMVRRKFRSRGLPLARVRPKDFTAAGIGRVPRTAGARGGLPVLDDGRDLEVTNVIWCTGFVPDFSWIDLPVFAEDGDPVHDRGIVGSEPACISWGWSSCMHWPRRWSAGWGGTRSTSPRTSHRPDGTVSPPGRSERDALMLGPTWTDGAY